MASSQPSLLGSRSARQKAAKAVYQHVSGCEPPHGNIASAAISAYYPGFTPARVKTWANQVLCMIAEYHMACVVKGPSTTSPILLEDIKKNLPHWLTMPPQKGTGVTDVRVGDHKARNLHVAKWLHCLDMTLSEEREASRSLVQSRHIRGCLLSYFLNPGTSNLCFEEVATRVLEENYVEHQRMKEHSKSSLHKSNTK